MLGWDVLVYRPRADASVDRPWDASTLARWSTGLSGLRWLEQLVDAGKAEYLGGDGYPCAWRVPARHLLAAIAHGLPANDSPMVFSAEGVQPAGFNGPLTIDLAQAKACAADEILDVEAWDQS